MLLAADVGLARLALGVEGIELLFEPLLRRLAGHSERGRREGLAAPRLPQPLAAIFGCSPLDARSTEIAALKVFLDGQSCRSSPPTPATSARVGRRDFGPPVLSPSSPSPTSVAPNARRCRGRGRGA